MSFRKCRWLVLLVLMAVGPLAVEGASLNIDELLAPPSPITEPDKIIKTHDLALGLPVIQSPSLAAGAEAAVATPSPGVVVLRVGSGIGFVATGAGSYEKSANPNATRIAQRQAYLVAFMGARKELAKTLSGLSLEAREAMMQSAFEEDTADKSQAYRSASGDESIRETLSGMLRSFTTYAVKDDGQGIVTVSIVTSPATRSACRLVSEGVIDADNMAMGLKRISHEINMGVVPPVGGRIVHVAETGETAVVSFGSAVIRQERDGTFSSQEKLVAQRRAKAQADKALVAMLQGDSLLWEYGMYSDTKEERESLEAVLSSAPGKDPEELSKTRRDFIARTSDSEIARSLVKGVLPQGVTSKTWISDDGGWSFAFNLIMPSIAAEARRAAAESGVVPVDAGKPEERASEEKSPAPLAPQSVAPSSTPPPSNPPRAPSAPVSGTGGVPEILKGVPEEAMLNIRIDAVAGVVHVSGEGVPPESAKGTGQGKLLARRAAILDMQRNALEFLKGVRLDSSTTMEDMVVTNDKVRSAVDGLIKRIAVTKSSWDGEIFSISGKINVSDIKSIVGAAR